jgi:quercetin dioxygenase-like cupin family protein
MTQVQKEWPDALHGASNVYKLIMENDRVRVLDVKFKPGDKAAMHSHPDHVVYVLADGTLKLNLPDGTSQQFELKAGQALWIGAGPHETTNLGKTEAHLVVVELKK